MNEYEMAFVCGSFVLLAWFVAYCLSWVAQCVWAFIDDSKIDESNWLQSKINLSEYKYPLYNVYRESKLDQAIKENKKPFAYSKNKDDKNKMYSSVDEKDKKHPWQGSGGIWSVALFTALTPFFTVLVFNFYLVTLIVLLSLSVVYLSRFARRSKKLFDKHIGNKDIHKAK